MSSMDFRYVAAMKVKEKPASPRPTKARFALAENVKELMRLYNKGFGTGIEPVELAEGSGISAKTIRRVLNPYDEHVPNLETIDALAAFFRISADDLIKPRDKSAALSGEERQTAHSPTASIAAAQRKENTKSKGRP